MLDRSDVPILIISDAPNARTGLGRIARDLAIRMKALDLGMTLPPFHVGTFGLGAGYTQTLPFVQYQINPAMGGLIPQNLPEVWNDFIGSRPERGIVFAIGNPTWLMWLSHTESLPKDSALRQFLETDPFEKWIYAPIDGDGPCEKLPGAVAEALVGWDRV